MIGLPGATLHQGVSVCGIIAELLVARKNSTSKRFIHLFQLQQNKDSLTLSFRKIPIPFGTAMQTRRKAIVKAIMDTLNGKFTDFKEATAHIMAYGQRYKRLDIFGVDWGDGGDIFAFTLMIEDHFIDVVISLRFGDPRLGFLLPNALLQSLENEFSDALRMLIGDEKTRLCNYQGLIDRGFDAYPRFGSDSYPELMAHKREHGIYLEFCFRGDEKTIVNHALIGDASPEVAGDTLGHAAIHILQCISSHVHLAQTKSKINQGKAERFEFQYEYPSIEIIRNYGIEPSQLEIIKEATPGSIGEFVLHVTDCDKENIAIFLEEVAHSTNKTKT